MNKKSLDFFFNQEIFELDSDEVATYLLPYSNDQINKCLNKKLKSLASSWDTLIEEPWKLGVTFKSVKNNSADNFILPEIYDATDNIKEAYFEFLSGYWEKIDINQVQLVNEFSIYLAKLLVDSNFEKRLLEIAITTFATAYIYNKSICIDEFILNNTFDEIKKYANKSMSDVNLKKFILKE